jgi:hypothetical protein
VRYRSKESFSQAGLEALYFILFVIWITQYMDDFVLFPVRGHPGEFFDLLAIIGENQSAKN